MIHIFLGTKAQLIKMAPIMAELESRQIDYNFIFSGQHQATIKNIREEFGIKEPDTTLYDGPDITGIVQMLWWSLGILINVLCNRKKIWKNDRSGIVLNHGDTFSTLLGSITARLSGLKNAHIESGLLSYNLFHPFPEEITRRMTFRLSDVFFAPGDWAIKNLTKYKGQKINTVHNTLMDALNASTKTIDSVEIEIPSYNFGVVSIHRFENIYTLKKLTRIVQYIEDISQKYSLLFILHKPTLKKLKQYKLYDRLDNNPNIELRPRYSYFQFIKLIKAAKFVVTDGGSNQEECFYLGKPCLILRKATERQEGLCENAILSKYKQKNIDYFFERLNQGSYQSQKQECSPTDIIVKTLMSYQ